jgi:F-type H+-transporting ATPase subunit b
MLEIHPTLLLYQGIIFIVFVFLLYRFAYRPLTKMIQTRKALIESNLNQAEQLKAEAEKEKIEYEDRRRQIEVERKQIMDTAAAEGNLQKEQIVAQGRDEVQRLLDRARLEIEKERRLAVRSAKADLGAIAIQLVRKFLKKGMNKKSEEALIASVAHDLGEKQWKS